MKKWLCILLALALALTLIPGGLAGCGAAAEAPDPSPEETGAPAETEAPAPAEEPALDLAAARSAYAPDTVVMTVDGTEIDWDKYSSALFQYLYTYYAYYGITDFSIELEEGTSLADAAKDYAWDTLSSNAMFHRKAEENGVTLSGERLSSIDEEISYYAALYYDGDKDALFEEAGITEEYYRYQAEAALLYTAILEHLYGEGCADFPSEDAIAWGEDNGYLHAKHILFRTVDDSYNPLDDETVAEKKALAEDVLARLRAAAPAVRGSLFDALMEDFSEDTGLAAYPDGYYFQDGDMIPEFYEAALALENGEISGLVEGFYGFHIIERLPLDADQTVEYDKSTYAPRTLRELAATELFENMLDEWYSAQDVRYVNGFDTLDAAALFPQAEEEPNAEETETDGSTS